VFSWATSSFSNQSRASLPKRLGSAARASWSTCSITLRTAASRFSSGVMGPGACGPNRGGAGGAPGGLEPGGPGGGGGEALTGG